MNHMQDINPIYHNPFGVAFQWKRNSVKDINKVQLVFRDTGLLLSRKELTDFQKNIKCALESHTLCQDCQQNESCRALLLDTPAPQVTLALSKKELNAVHDLVEGTLFQLQLDNLLYGPKEPGI
ncbi:hypothetical protein [Ulvibacterium marinum]|uniref:hypothetical protein n=1 Tax=Ulvibacterium marinum TaxID=2419782 RepID=UPI00249471D6|nr:hypothetical protein [Ulvibacterium marinum]